MASRRSRPGMAGILRAQQQRQQIEQAGQKLAEETLQHVQVQMTEFKNKLEKFAVMHKNDIRKDPSFRAQFQQMCSTIGVDPLASNKGYWSELLGVGDFYFELGVQVADICIATRNQNGGLIDLQDLTRLVNRRRGGTVQLVSEDDVRRSIEKLKVLGNGFKLYSVGGKTLVVSVPMELNSDQTTVLELAENNQGAVSVSLIRTRLGWDKRRADQALQHLVSQGMVWVDDQASDGSRWYYVVSVWLSDRSRAS